MNGGIHLLSLETRTRAFYSNQVALLTVSPLARTLYRPLSTGGVLRTYHRICYAYLQGPMCRSSTCIASLRHLVFLQLPFLSTHRYPGTIYDESTGIRVGCRAYRLRQRALRCFLRRGSGRDSVCKEGRGDRVYLLGLNRVRVLTVGGY